MDESINKYKLFKFEAWIKRSDNVIIEFCSMESVRRFAFMMSEGSVPFLSRETGFHDLATFGRQQFFALVYRDTGVDILRTNGMPPSEWQLQIQRRKNARTNSNVNDGVPTSTVILRVDLTSQQTQERIVYDRTATNSSAVTPSAHGTSADLLAVLAPPAPPPLKAAKQEVDVLGGIRARELTNEIVWSQSLHRRRAFGTERN
ncbi:hypothetical protein niasHS_004821 [Heterodera schachtii]|uniref:Uncharacterized protein n=2 Tax=Heterodera TaxID=34509 RepID=A0ABD2JU25_HETSC